MKFLILKLPALALALMFVTQVLAEQEKNLVLEENPTATNFGGGGDLNSSDKEHKTYSLSNYNLSLGLSVSEFAVTRTVDSPSGSFGGAISAEGITENPSSSKTEETQSIIYNETFYKLGINAEICKLKWSSCLSLNINPQKENRGFNIFFRPGLNKEIPLLRFYFGIAMGLGWHPHRFPEEDIKEHFSVGGELFTGIRTKDIYKKLSLWTEGTLNYMSFPFGDKDIKRTNSVASLKLGISYHF